MHKMYLIRSIVSSIAYIYFIFLEKDATPGKVGLSSLFIFKIGCRAFNLITHTLKMSVMNCCSSAHLRRASIYK